MPSFFGRMFAKYLSRAAALPLLSSTHCTDFNRATILKSSMESSSTAVRNTRDNSGSAQQPINDNSVPTAIADGNTKIKSRSIFKRVKNRLSKIRNGLGKSRKKPAEHSKWVVQGRFRNASRSASRNAGCHASRNVGHHSSRYASRNAGHHATGHVRRR
jgi:hypothetical protein